MNAMDWLLDYDDCLDGEHGTWWQRRAEQHQDEIFAGEKPGKWFAWRDVRQREQPPLAAVPSSPDTENSDKETRR